MRLCFQCRSPAACRNAAACQRPAAAPAPRAADPDPIDPAGLSREIRVVMGHVERVQAETGGRIREFEGRLATIERRLRQLERTAEA